MSISAEQNEFVHMEPSEILKVLPLQTAAAILCFGAESAAFVSPMAERVGRTGRIVLVEEPQSGFAENQIATGVREVVTVISLSGENEPSLPLDDRSMDWVFMIHSLHQFYFKGILTPLFKEIRRIHKPDGKLIVIESEPTESSGSSVQLRIPSTQMNSIVYPNGYFLFEAMPLEHNMYLGFYKRQPHYNLPDDDDLGN